ncbi:MAG: hypothetical protein ACRC9V_11740, partial [Aeromonas sp.]
PSVEAGRVADVSAAIPVPPSAPSVATAPSVPMPMRTANNAKSGQSQAPTDVSRDLSDRQIAHIVTGAYSGAV